MIGQKLGGDKWSLADAGYPRRRRPPLSGGRRAARWVTDDSSCCRPDFWQVAKVGLIRWYAAEAAVRPARVVEREVSFQPSLGLRNAVVGVQIDLVVLDRTPQALDKDVVAPAALAVHADLDAAILEQRGEVGAGELAALVGVEDFWRAIAVDRLPDGIQAEIRRQRVGDAPAEHLAAEPIHDGHQIDEAPAHRDIGDVSGPDLVRPVDGEVPQQIRIDLVPRPLLAGIRLPVDSSRNTLFLFTALTCEK